MRQLSSIISLDLLCSSHFWTRKSRPLRKILLEGYLVPSDHPRHSIPIKARRSKKNVKQLQDVFSYNKTKTTPYRPQGNSVSERMNSTLYAMFLMYSDIAQNNWAEVLPFIQLTHNTSFSLTMHETPFFLMFGRQARLPFDIIFGIPHVGRSTTTEKFAHSTRENLQIAF